MKKILCSISVLTTLCVFTNSCSKRSETPLFSKEIADAWHWVRTDGGIAYNIHQTPASTGQNIDLQLTDDSKYYVYTNGILTSQGTYTMKTAKSIVDNQDKPVIDFSNGADMMIEKINNDSLELSDNCYDGVGSLYVK